MTTKRKQTRTLLGISLLASLSGVVSYAQTEEEEEIFELSPFTVDASTDEGYRATATTAGSRLNTELKDVSASVSVLTNDFMDDLGATDLLDALGMVAGAETVEMTDNTSDGLKQGYTGGDFGDRNSEEGSVRVRGLGRASKSMNYLPVIMGVDRYNVDRAEFLRGPNSILFGLGQPAGMINSTTKRANLNNEVNKISFIVDNFGTFQTTLDAGRVLIEDKLGVRFAAKVADNGYMFDHADQDDTRFYLTTTFKPTASTKLTASYEDIQVDSRTPTYRPLQDNVSGWLDLYNEYAPGMTEEERLANFYWDASEYGKTINGTINGEVTRIRDDMDGKDNGLYVAFDGSDWETPINDQAQNWSSFKITGGRPASSRRSTFMRSSSPLENRSGYTDPQVVSEDIFPYMDYDIGSLNGSYRDEHDTKAFFELEQKISEDLYFSASYMKEDYEKEQNFPILSQTRQISLDINVNNQDGTPNENFLRPFIFGRNLGQGNSRENETSQFQINYDFDFAEKSDRLGFLGSHRLTSLYTRGTEDNLGWRWQYQPVNEFGDPFEYKVNSANPDSANYVNSSYRWHQMWYIGDSVELGDTALNITGLPTNISPTKAPSSYMYWDDASSVRSFVTTDAPIELGKVNITGGRGYTTTKRDGVGVSLQSFFWDRKVVSTVGWRTDTVENRTWNRMPDDKSNFDENGIIIGGTTTPEGILGYSRDHYTDYNTFEISADTMTYGAVYHVTPWLRLFGNFSENFALTQQRFTPDYQPIDPQSGETKDFGIGLRLLEDKLHIKATVFETSQLNADSRGGAATASLRIEPFESKIYEALIDADIIAQRAINLENGIVDDPDEWINPNGNFFLDQWYTYGPEGTITTEKYERPDNPAETEKSVAEGLEIEITYNPTKNWRFAGNISKVESTASELGGGVREFFELRAPFYKQWFDLGLEKDGDFTTPYLADNEELLSDELVDAVVGPYLEGTARDGEPVFGLAEYTAKLTGNYKFTDGRMKGFSIGGNFAWESGKAIGARQKVVEIDIAGLENQATLISDPDQRLIGDDILTGSFMVNYRKKIFNDKVDWRIQLNAKRAIGEHGLRVIRVNPDSSPVYGIANPATYQLSNSFSF